MNTPINLDQNAYDIEDSEDVIGLVKGLVNGHHPGILSTVDHEGRPQLRWMATLSFDDFPVFHTLTAPDSRKVAEIARHPEVNWMFFNSDTSLVVNLRGRARVIADVEKLKKIWKKVADRSQAYFLNRYVGKPGFVAIETRVESIECNSPSNAFRFVLDPSTL